MITNKSTIAKLCSSVYNYDNIRNCKSTLENGSNFTPAYDLDGNQSKIQSSTGEWLVRYNANNRPISFIQGNTRVECNYDYMGCQYLRKVYKNSSSSPSTNERYIYRGYLRLGALDMNNGANLYQALLWDPTEPQATRPLALLNNNATYYYGHDFNKNVTELFNANGDIVNHYDYRPYGDLLESTESIPNPIQYSSEIHDPELGLISYNYRHYNPEDGRWLTRDPIQEQGGLNLYGFVGNNSLLWVDLLGLKVGNHNSDFSFNQASCTLTVVVYIGYQFVDTINFSHGMDEQKVRKNYPGIAWDNDSKAKLKKTVKSAIEDNWNNVYKLQSKPKVGQKPENCPCPQGISLVLDIREDNIFSIEDYSIKVVRDNPEEDQTSYRANASTTQMSLISATVKRMEVFRDTVAHEFGHALGIQHPGFGLPNMIPNDHKEYDHVGKDKEGRVVDGMNDLMGNSARQKRPFYYDKWKEYMGNQYSCCEFDFHTTDPINRKG